ncbi:MAG: RAMP superfamily CRISPR-associated protein [Halothece sp.]
MPEQPKRPELRQKPNRPQPPRKPNDSSSSKPSRQKSYGGGNRNSNGGNPGGGRGDDNSSPPSPWLKPESEPNPSSNASFVEYLRWMREADHPHKDPTKVQILQMATEKANYRDRLSQLTKRTQLIATTTFEAKCPWRIRVGGHRGPENILLPAFDALGMPYIPSSTLRGVARTQAIREIMAKDQLKWSEAEKRVAPYFGSLESEGKDRAGKVVFLDAYPLPSQNGGLEMDMANNIWKWEGNSIEYSPNPNPFLSLKEPTFVIGLRLASHCQELNILNSVKEWLIKGLESGVGSQVNTGYGEMLTGTTKNPNEFLRLEFGLEGQLIHGYQNFAPWDPEKKKWLRGKPEPEVRPIAFKSMLRYWFRAFALGVLDQEKVKNWEAIFFGGIQPQHYGWIQVRVEKIPKTKDSFPQEGILTLAYSPEALKNRSQLTSLETLFKNLTWMIFNLGGVGQGARRPLYSRKSFPKERGSALYLEIPDSFWQAPTSLQEFRDLFQKRLRDFYTALAELVPDDKVTFKKLKSVTKVSMHEWADAVDYNCRILVVYKDTKSSKVHSLNLLHQQFHKLEDEKKYSEAKSLCGGASKDNIFVNGKAKKRKAVPSPIWIVDLEYYQVVTVFGATENPRKEYIAELRRQTDSANFAQIFPLS